jgi:light-regulated signal transduction histidine kinase (bacteriophytochrome)
VQDSPSFGQADLTNCERELIHLAGSVQPHGVLLIAREADLVVIQASANTQSILGKDANALLGLPLEALGGDLAAQVRQMALAHPLEELVPMACQVVRAEGPLRLEGGLHRLAGGYLSIELEPVAGSPGAPTAIEIGQEVLLERLSAAMQRFGSASNIGVLADAVAQTFRDLTGYDRVMVYKFDPDGHGKIISEARDPRLDSLLGHHYPASDIPQRARELYIRNRVRVLVDVNYEPAPLLPQLLPDGAELDMSLCYLRSMSPLHLQYLKNMGVTATLVISLVREGRLWGLIAAHHYSPRNLRFAIRTASELLAEVISTRITAIESYAHAQVAILVRRLEQRLIEATSIEGDWRLALFRNPRTLLQPLEATGAALFHEGEILTAGEVPSTPELRALLQWIDGQDHDPPFRCSCVGRENPALASLTPVASGVMAVKLSTMRPDYLMWFRKEQLQTVTWAGDPHKAIVGNDPLDLSPRRSFAAWSEIVRGTSLPWSNAEIVLARAVGTALVDIILQVHAVRLLIAEHQLTRTRLTVEASKEPVVIAAADGRVLFLNEACTRLVGERGTPLAHLRDFARLFVRAEHVSVLLRALQEEHEQWRGELDLLGNGGATVPVSLRAEVVPARDGGILGFILILLDQSHSRRAAQAREHLEHSLSQAAQGQTVTDDGGHSLREPDEVIRAILTNASMAAMDIADVKNSATVAPLLEEVESSTKRATALYNWISRSASKL